MNKDTRNKLWGTLSVPVGLSIMLVPFSLLIGWNLVTLVTFWLVLTPGLAICLPMVISGKEHQMFKSIAGLLAFYALMVLLIFEHFRSDYFKLMIVSALVNTALVAIFSRAAGSGTARSAGQRSDTARAM